MIQSAQDLHRSGSHTVFPTSLWNKTPLGKILRGSKHNWNGGDELAESPSEEGTELFGSHRVIVWAHWVWDSASGTLCNRSNILRHQRQDFLPHTSCIRSLNISGMLRKNTQQRYTSSDVIISRRGRGLRSTAETPDGHSVTPSDQHTTLLLTPPSLIYYYYYL